jgi:diguanylate cyclase (GGDEF)-like protein
MNASEQRDNREGAARWVGQQLRLVEPEIGLVPEVAMRRLAGELELLRDENARLVEQLRTDALTRVASRSAWDEALAAQERHLGAPPVSVVFVDVDGLKAVNDEAGHAAGDALLKHCAQVLASSVGAGDLVARIGGDEFGVLLRGADEAKAAAWCARLDATEAGGDEPPVSWSFGWASVPPAPTLRCALIQADRRMYECKLARRVARG